MIKPALGGNHKKNDLSSRLVFHEAGPCLGVIVMFGLSFDSLGIIRWSPGSKRETPTWKEESINYIWLFYINGNRLAESSTTCGTQVSRYAGLLAGLLKYVLSVARLVLIIHELIIYSYNLPYILSYHLFYNLNLQTNLVYEAVVSTSLEQRLEEKDRD